MRKTRNTASDGVKVKGFFRLNIVEDANGKSKVVGDSGWLENQVVDLGFQDYLCKTLAGGSGSKFIDHLALGTGGAPAATDTSLAGEIMSSTQRGTVSTSVISSKTIQFTAAFASSDSFLTATSNLSNVALINTTATNGTIFSGAAYTSSACATNQSVRLNWRTLAAMLIRKLREFGGHLSETIPSGALVLN